MQDQGPEMVAVPRSLIEDAAMYQEIASAEELDELERELSAAGSFDVWAARERQDAIYRDAAECEMGGDWGGGEL